MNMIFDKNDLIIYYDSIANGEYIQFKHKDPHRISLQQSRLSGDLTEPIVSFLNDSEVAILFLNYHLLFGYSFSEVQLYVLNSTRNELNKVAVFDEALKYELSLDTIVNIEYNLYKEGNRFILNQTIYKNYKNIKSDTIKANHKYLITHDSLVMVVYDIGGVR